MAGRPERGLRGRDTDCLRWQRGAMSGSPGGAQLSQLPAVPAAVCAAVNRADLRSPPSLLRRWSSWQRRCCGCEGTPLICGPELAAEVNT